ncbi:MAG: hypothetical protein AAF772_14790 [Acidobacteriota bacterium]
MKSISFIFLRSTDPSSTIHTGSGDDAFIALESMLVGTTIDTGGTEHTRLDGAGVTIHDHGGNDLVSFADRTTAENVTVTTGGQVDVEAALAQSGLLSALPGESGDLISTSLPGAVGSNAITSTTALIALPFESESSQRVVDDQASGEFGLTFMGANRVGQILEAQVLIAQGDTAGAQEIYDRLGEENVLFDTFFEVTTSVGLGPQGEEGRQAYIAEASSNFRSLYGLAPVGSAAPTEPAADVVTELTTGPDADPALANGIVLNIKQTIGSQHLAELRPFLEQIAPTEVVEIFYGN